MLFVNIYKKGYLSQTANLSLTLYLILCKTHCKCTELQGLCKFSTFSLPSYNKV